MAIARGEVGTFATVRSEGGLLPPDLLVRVAASDGDLKGLTPADYGLSGGQRLTEAASVAWSRVTQYWAAFRATREALAPAEPGPTETREQWLIPLFRELGYGRLVYRAAAEEIGDRRYPITHRAGEGAGAPPIHTVGTGVGLDARALAAGIRRSPHGLLQEYLNASPHVWGLVTNGLQLRLLRDNQHLGRPMYVEFDLEAMLEGGNYADFVLLFLLLHRSRLPREGQAADESWLERWRSAAEDQGGRARDALRDGVERAIAALGQGLLEHPGPANDALRVKLAKGSPSDEQYYRQLLRLVYRLLFLLVAEERDLLLPPGADAEVRERYQKHYGVGRLRAMAARPGIRETRYADLWHGLLVTFDALQDDNRARALGLKPLGGGLFGQGSCRDVADPHGVSYDGGRPADLPRPLISNARLLEAIHGLSYFAQDGRPRRVNYRDMDVEELGSVYESLLDRHPRIEEGPRFSLQTGTERKSTGSYYTHQGLVRELIGSALEPVLSAAVARGRTPEERRQAVLALRVCDPACGSGHFLLAAARRIGQELARLEGDEREPNPETIRAATHEAIRHCIYGVDKNPLAVDLCRVALWIEGHEGGQPLGFLDHHIKRGDSLIGVVDLEVLESGIPDAAYTAVTGDDKGVARDVKQRNAVERKGQRTLFEQGEARDILGSLRVRMDEIARLPDATVEDVQAIQAAYGKLLGREDWTEMTLVCHLWTWAFFAPLHKEDGWDGGLVPTTATVRRIVTQGRGGLDGRTVGKAAADAMGIGFFHWPLEFPEVFGRDEPGFDVVLGNPPWERVKLQEQEFFAVRDPEIAGAKNAAERKRLIASLEQERPALYAAFETAKREAEAASLFLRGSERYPLTGRGDINLYSAFAESMARGIRRSGRAGIIVPTGIATDDTNKHFFGWLVHEGRIATLYDFENREGLFPGVHRSYKFSLLAIAGRSRPAAAFDVAFFLTRPAQLHEPGRVFTLTGEEIALLNPNTKTCPIFRTARDAEITKALYLAAPVLINEATGENPWGVTFKTLFHMSNDSHLFRTRMELEGRGAVLGADGRFRRGGEVWLPLYEAKLIHQFDHRFATYTSDSETRDLTPAEHADPDVVALPRYWVDEREVAERATGKEFGQSWFVTYRDIVRSTDVRTFIAAVQPRAGAANHLAGFAEPDKRALCGVLGNFNAFAFDFAVRQKAGGTHLNFFVVKQLPVLPPETYTPELLDEIVPRVLELVYTAHDLAPFARDCGYDGEPFVWDEERRAGLRAELDGIYAHLYGLSRDDFAYILNQFPIVRRKDEAAFGEYRTMRLCLAAYDRFVGIGGRGCG
ncbi:MAG: N-6 DNA methylase [Thermomicrobiales bacterium]